MPKNVIEKVQQTPSQKSSFSSDDKKKSANYFTLFNESRPISDAQEAKWFENKFEIIDNYVPLIKVPG